VHLVYHEPRDRDLAQPPDEGGRPKPLGRDIQEAERPLHGGPPYLAGIFGASLAPYIATWLANNYGLQYVGYYLSAAAVLTMIGLVATRETKNRDLGADS
jgi:hypothetical protein